MNIFDNIFQTAIHKTKIFTRQIWLSCEYFAYTVNYSRFSRTLSAMPFANKGGTALPTC